MSTANKKTPNVATNEDQTVAAVGRHHPDGRKHSGEVDIDLNDQCSNLELQLLLIELRPLLQKVIEARKRCKHDHPVDFNPPNYHNATVCDGDHS